jgi:radical SAM superfamily enzyme YgiQ (UPF0313 family)
LLQKVQTLTYGKIRIGLELFLRLARGVFERPATKDLINRLIGIMEYIGRIIRPPGEADSILLQVTTGCSHNRCTFCGAYKDKRFSIKSEERIDADLRYAGVHFRERRRLFLVDGDALIIPQARLLRILDTIRERLPGVTRIGSYAGAKAVSMKTDRELSELRERGLGMLYMGLESGDDETLGRVRKWGDSAGIVAQAGRAKRAGMRLNITVLLGLGGTERSEIHARETGRALSAIDPGQAAALTLMLIPGTPLHAEWEQGRFHLPDAAGMLRELRLMLQSTTLSKGLFLSNHASNYLPLKVRLPREKHTALELIDRALDGGVSLRPESFRRL